MILFQGFKGYFSRGLKGNRFRAMYKPISLLKVFFVAMLLGGLLTGCNISGRVVVDGVPQAGVVVTIDYQNELRTATTDKKGIYRFRGIDAGSYYLWVDFGDAYTHPMRKRVSKLLDQLNVDNADFRLDQVTSTQVDSGSLVGFVEDNGVHAWFGVPFAQAPVGALRWKAPLPPQSWGKSLPAGAFPDACIQYADLLSSEPFSEFGSVIGSEDCLYFNIWAPAQADPAGAPVMFWIHGGGNSIGEGSAYNGQYLAEKYGAVVITTNYRLGPFGWFSHPAFNGQGDALDQSGNFGTLDLVRGLQWVQENISAFGGDPNRVMVFGESAGAADALTLLGSPLAAGLFHGTIVQSGGLGWATVAQSQNYIEQGGDASSSREAINRMLIADGSAADRSAAKALQDAMSDVDLRAYIYSKSAAEILSVYDGGFGGMIPMPKLIRDGVVLPNQTALSLFESGNYNQVPAVLGTNRDETKLFTVLSPEFSTTLFNLIPFLKDEEYFNLNAEYTSKAWKLRAVDDIAREMVKHQPGEIFAYRFDWDDEAQILFFDLGTLLGAAHGLEINFAFADIEGSIVDLLPVLLYNKGNLDSRTYLADNMSSYWFQFAATGNPGKGAGDLAPAQWLPWSTQPDSEKMIILDSESDGGIRMSNDELTADILRDELQAETGFPEPEQKCKVYLDVIGNDAYHQQNCL